jgi:hypothetical protein
MPVTRGDIEAKLREVKAEVDQTAADAKPKLQRVAIGLGLALLVLTFLLGRRAGRKRTTFVEIRRV